MQKYPNHYRARLAAYLILPAWLWLGACGAPAAEKGPNSACLECHSDKTLTTTNAAGKEISLFVDEAKMAATIHKTNTCASCHADISEKHPDDNVPAKAVNCAACHEPEGREYATSIHGVSHTLGASGAAGCADCHGSHNILPAKHADSPVFKLNLPATCAKCHSNPGLTREYQMKFPEAAAQYMESIHGRALLQDGVDRGPVVQRLPRRP